MPGAAFRHGPRQQEPAMVSSCRACPAEQAAGRCPPGRGAELPMSGSGPRVYMMSPDQPRLQVTAGHTRVPTALSGRSALSRHVQGLSGDLGGWWCPRVCVHGRPLVGLSPDHLRPPRSHGVLPAQVLCPACPHSLPRSPLPARCLWVCLWCLPLLPRWGSWGWWALGDRSSVWIIPTGRCQLAGPQPALAGVRSRQGRPSAVSAVEVMGRAGADVGLGAVLGWLTPLTLALEIGFAQ